MKYFLTVCFLFIIGATGGYLIELIFRRIVHKRWINPGFLVGPYLPLYGFGVVVLYSITRLLSLISFNNDILKYAIILLIMAIMMTLVEFIAGYIFILKMNIKLWDYSNQKWNYKGIICPLFSFFWTIIGAIYLFVIDPFLVDGVTKLMENLEWSFIIGIVAGIIMVDIFYSFQVSIKIKEFAKKNNIVVNYENFKNHIKEKEAEFKEKHSFLFPFKEKDVSIKNYLLSYKEKMNSFLDKINKK